MADRFRLIYIVVHQNGQGLFALAESNFIFKDGVDWWSVPDMG